VEVLAALALAAFLASVSGQMAIRGLEARDSAVRSVHELQHRAIVFETLAADFAAILPAAEDGPVTVFGTPQQVLQLQALVPVDQEPALHVARRPATVHYRLLRSGDSGGTDLVREMIDQTTVSAGTIRETLAREVADFSVSVLVKDQWVSQWAADDGAADVRAVRVSVNWDDRRSESRTFLLRLQG
jgi:hypothetical protein